MSKRIDYLTEIGIEVRQPHRIHMISPFQEEEKVHWLRKKFSFLETELDLEGLKELNKCIYNLSYEWMILYKIRNHDFKAITSTVN